MVRPLDSSLTTALQALSRRPAIHLTLEDHVLHYASYQSPGNADCWHDACLASDNSLIRVQVTRSAGGGITSAFQFQRITDPSLSTQWTVWSSLPGSSGLMFEDGGCAVSNSNGTLRAFAQRGTGGNQIWVWTSTNNGVSWSGPQTVLSPPGGAFVKGLASAGNNDLFFLYDVSGGDSIGCAFYSSGSWSALTSWTLPALPSAAGVAVAWTGSQYSLVYSDSYNLFSCTFAPTSGVWTAGPIIAPATTTAIGRFAPHLSFVDGIYTLTFVESDSGFMTGLVYNYPRQRFSSDLLHWSSGLILPDLPCIYGAVSLTLPAPVTGNAGARGYVITQATVSSAPLFQASNQAQFLDLSAAVLSYQRYEQSGLPARLEVQIDNAGGVYNALATSGNSYKPFSLNAKLVLSEGYYAGVSNVPDLIQTGVYHLEQIHWLRSPQENRLLLVAKDVTRDLDLSPRFQNVYTNQTLGFLVTEICAQAGLLTVQLPTSSQVLQIVSSFVLQAGQSYRQVLNELCSTYGLAYFLDQDEVVQFREFSSSDPLVWTYQPELELVSFGSNDQRANHIIVSGKPPAIGPLGSVTSAEAYDLAHLHQVGSERLLHHVDPKLTTLAQCAQKASLLLAQEVRLQITSTATVPLNPALQLFDCVALNDVVAPVGSGQQDTGRIIQLRALYDAQQALYELRLGLEGR